MKENEISLRQRQKSEAVNASSSDDDDCSINDDETTGSKTIKTFVMTQKHLLLTILNS